MLPNAVYTISSLLGSRLAGAYRNLGQDKIAHAILKTMTTAGFDVRETDPFNEPSPIKFDPRERSPFVNGTKLMWQEMRAIVIATFSKGPWYSK